MPHTVPPRTAATRALVLWQATADPCLCRRHSNTQRWFGSDSAVYLVPGAHKILFDPFEHLCQVWGLILKMISPLLPSCWDCSFAFRHGVSFFGGINILFLMVVQQ